MSEMVPVQSLIDHIKSAVDVDPWAKEMAEELLNKQEAKPVIVTINAYGTRFYHCPRCNRDLCVYPIQLYCSNCGQAVKWEKLVNNLSKPDRR